ncbi:hypothetical protein [Staphylococcus kloosii]|uniref:Uncharacterized protein n=2 Tax=Staphylococcus kloosii TaxID=29384 RepID=A0ABQ0XKL8_9STAP|nr:hypothetical protein C7J89_00725 [Staphylococcus kloosii]MBF7023092.1 hypothetical protein [Staphylococcus kloosii]MBF7029869.1 hypothetical protein [Staphylococcus kloosii]PNZ07648.1 hypothetical protein CD136_02680 [Staphylococcus kloosii]PTJ77464.1 hypothetical protein BUZ59_07675 [Staphylococcus kloosii]
MNMHIYACLFDEWVDISKADNVLIEHTYTDANQWYKALPHDIFDYDYVDIRYRDIDYQVHPCFIEILMH